MTRYILFTAVLSLVLAGMLPVSSLQGPAISVTGGFKSCIQNESVIAPRFPSFDSNSIRRSYYHCHPLYADYRATLYHTNLRSSLLVDTDTSTGLSDVPENAIPPIDPKSQSKVEQEFYAMMRKFASFTARDISSVSNYRYRALFEGFAAGATEPQVIKAFANIFEDLLPVRVAGRIIFKRLLQIMESSIEKRDYVDEKLQSMVGLTTDEIDEGRRAFMIMDLEGEGELTIDQLVDWGIVATVAELLECNSFDEYIKTFDQDYEGRLTFEEFMVGLQRCNGDSRNYNCNLNDVLAEIIKMMEPIEEKRNKLTVSERKRKASDQYDSMVRAFGEWEDLVPKGDGRMIEVLRGCFAGAKNDKVLNALKIVYTDYSAIRIAGDLIFKLMRRLIQHKM